jgi:nucleoside-diphosphate-sugar epimerase
MNIFFTGHRGFLGKSCIPHLQKFHEVFTSEIDLTNDHDLEKFLYEYKIDFIIHAAVRAGRRNEPDTAENLYDNLLMFENLSKLQIPMINFCSGAAYDRRTSIEDASEGDLGKSIPTDNYGLSKYIISKRIHTIDHVWNLRFFNCFGIQETKDRFTSVNIRNYKNKKSMILHKNMNMDFFYIEDFLKVLDFYLESIFHTSAPKDLNLVYKQKYSFVELAEIINTLSTHQVDIELHDDSYFNSYTGCGNLLASLDIELMGLKNSFKHYYNLI